MSNANIALASPTDLSLPSPSQFEAYARAVQRWPMLSEDEEQRLVTAWRDRHDRDAARDLVASHLRLVVRVVRDHRGYGLSEGDLAQEGTVGLMRAVHKFDPAVGVRLAAYAIRWIEAEIREFIFKNWRVVRLGGTSAMKKLFFGYRATVASLRDMKADRTAGVTAEEVSRAMGLTEEQVHQARAYFGGRDMALDGPRSDDDDAPSEALMLEALVDDSEGIAAQVEEEDRVDAVQKAVRQAVAKLPERDRQVLIARRLSTPPRGLAEVGEELGISAERVRQLEQRAAARLAVLLEEQGAQSLVA